MIEYGDFTEVVKLNINIFENGTDEDYNKIFTKINTYSNTLTENELLASTLYEIKIELDTRKKFIKKYNVMINKFYNERDVGKLYISFK